MKYIKDYIKRNKDTKNLTGGLLEHKKMYH